MLSCVVLELELELEFRPINVILFLVFL